MNRKGGFMILDPKTSTSSSLPSYKRDNFKNTVSNITILTQLHVIIALVHIIILVVKEYKSQ